MQRTILTHRYCSRPVLGSFLLASTMLAGMPVAFAQDNTGAGGGIETVVVTAEKREENLQRVPMNVTAITAQKISELHLSDFTDFAKYMPSVTYAVSGQGSNGGPGFSNVTMRGVASDQNGNHSGPEPTVGVYFDEIPITTINGTLDIPTYDVERVEALSGPQGTLYGASAESGVVRIISNPPDPSQFEAGYTVEGNTVDHGGTGWKVNGYINQPLTDNIALRVVAWDEHDAGYIDNVHGTRTYTFDTGAPPITLDNADRVKKNYNTVDKLGARAALRIDLDNNWTITPSLMAQTERSDGIFGYDPSVGDLKVTHFLPEYVHDKWYQAGLTVQGKIGDLDLVYAGGYTDRRVSSSADYTDYTFWYDQLYPSYVDFFDNKGHQIDPTQNILGKDHFTKVSNEVRLSSSKDDRFRWVVGLFQEEQKHFILQDYVIQGLADASSVSGWPNTLWLTDEERIDRDYAAFGEASYDILPNLTLTGGIRFFKADNSLQGFFGFHSYEADISAGGRCFAPTSVDRGPCTDLNARVKDTGETHKVNLTWQIDDDRMVYATYSTGFRPGGVNRVSLPGTSTPLPPYAADTLDNYEIGWKTSWNDNTVRFNGAIFVENWNNFQFPFLGPNSVTIIANAGQARIKGVETNVIWEPIDSLTLTGAAAYTDAQLTQPYCGGDCAVNAVQSPDGTQLPITPKWKLNATARYEFPVADFNAHVQGSVVHQSGVWPDLRIADRQLLGKTQAYTTFDFTTGVDMNNWSVELFVNNAFDERAQLGRYAECSTGVCGFQPYYLVAQPRTVGLSFSQKF
ncbi:MAG TPA: TonB-dependent receptor [Rhizomicrobium sp.]|jgi:outer membrane receptor protein involved in Fe transport|nr:TonB-dependent receptor [Rhizomicrobium sp.]